MTKDDFQDISDKMDEYGMLSQDSREVSETKENSLTDTFHNVVRKFFFEGKMEIRMKGNVTEFIGFRKIKVFTNPKDRHTFIKIHQILGDISVRLRDVTGKSRLLKTNLQGGKHTLATGCQHNDMYFLQIIFDNDKRVQKVLINR